MSTAGLAPCSGRAETTVFRAGWSLTTRSSPSWKWHVVLLEAVIAFFRVILPPAQRVTDRKTIDEGESSSSAALESFPNERSDRIGEARTDDCTRAAVHSLPP